MTRVFIICPNMSMNVKAPLNLPNGEKVSLQLSPLRGAGGGPGGEYRSRTDDLLRARQAL